MHCRMLSSFYLTDLNLNLTSSSHPLDTSRNPIPSRDNWNHLQALPNAPWWGGGSQSLPWLRTIALNVRLLPWTSSPTTCPLLLLPFPHFIPFLPGLRGPSLQSLSCLHPSRMEEDTSLGHPLEDIMASAHTPLARGNHKAIITSNG